MSGPNEAVGQLVQMGFAAHTARDALAATGNSVDGAISRLLGTAKQDTDRVDRRSKRAASPTPAAAIDLTDDSPSPVLAAAPAAAAAGGGQRRGLQGWIAKARTSGTDAEHAHALQQDEDRKRQNDDEALARSMQQQEEQSKRVRTDQGPDRSSFGARQPGSFARSGAARSPSHQLAARQRPDSDARTDGLIELLKDQYRTPSGKWSTRATAAICELCPHFTQKGLEGSAEGTSHWSCGFRNTQMLCAALLAGERGDEFRRVLFDGAGFVPGVGDLQCWIERAWDSGWDAAARQQFECGRLRDTAQWIGACEVWAMLRSFGVQVEVVDFKHREGMSEEVGRQRLIDWIWRYFTSPDPPNPNLQDVARPWRRQQQHAGAGAADGMGAAGLGLGGNALRSTENLPQDAGGLRNHGLLSPAQRQQGRGAAAAAAAAAGGGGPSRYRPPLYLQHAGHSRTVVGIERRVCILENWAAFSAHFLQR